MTCIAGDRGYACTVELEPVEGAQGGLLLFYSERAYFGFGFDGRRISTYAYGERHDWLSIDVAAPRIELQIINDHQIVTMKYRVGCGAWKKHPWQFEVSGVHQNVLGGFLSLRPSLFSCGAGRVRFRDFRYRGLA